MIPLPYFIIVEEQTAAVITRLGRFGRIAPPGWTVIWPFEAVRGRVDLRLQEMNVTVETKTVDDVFLKVMVAVQYRVMPAKIREAFYELSNPRMQIESFVYDEVRAVVPNMRLDDVFKNKDEIANAVRAGLQETMSTYGYEIIKTLVNDIDPDANVKKAMNEINAATRIRRASEERGEAEKILRIKTAEAEAESMRLRGKGIADQRRAIVDGLRQSVEEFARTLPGTTPQDVMQMVILTQYFDTLKEIGAQARSNTIMIPHSPGAMGDLMSQLREAVTMGNVISDSARMARNDPPPASDATDGVASPEPSVTTIDESVHGSAPPAFPPSRPPR